MHPSWQLLIEPALRAMNPAYISQLAEDGSWLPEPKNIFHAFSLPLANTQRILFGESPYPRAQSANGYAFWDAAVNNLWSAQGLSKEVNRATSLRNFIKMLLCAKGDLDEQDTSPQAIAKLDKKNYVQTLPELFENLLSHGFLLLNASLVWREGKVNDDAKHWQPFMTTLLHLLHQQKPDIELVLLGNIAKKISTHEFKRIEAEHPYNLSFIKNKKMRDYFGPLNLLSPRHQT